MTKSDWKNMYLAAFRREMEARERIVNSTAMLHRFYSGHLDFPHDLMADYLEAQMQTKELLRARHGLVAS